MLYILRFTPKSPACITLFSWYIPYICRVEWSVCLKDYFTYYIMYQINKVSNFRFYHCASVHINDFQHTCYVSAISSPAFFSALFFLWSLPNLFWFLFIRLSALLLRTGWQYIIQYPIFLRGEISGEDLRPAINTVVLAHLFTPGLSPLEQDCAALIGQVRPRTTLIGRRCGWSQGHMRS